MSNFDELLAKIASSGAPVTVVHNVVQAGATLTMHFGCHFGGGHTTTTTAKVTKNRSAQRTVEEDDQEGEVEAAASREDRGAPAPTPSAPTPSAPAPAAPAPASPLLAEIKSKVALLQGSLVNQIASHLERLDTLSEEQLGQIKTVFDSRASREDELNQLDTLFDGFFPDLEG